MDAQVQGCLELEWKSSVNARHSFFPKASSGPVVSGEDRVSGGGHKIEQHLCRMGRASRIGGKDSFCAWLGDVQMPEAELRDVNTK